VTNAGHEPKPRFPSGTGRHAVNPDRPDAFGGVLRGVLDRSDLKQLCGGE
jgi:hypothetical protein